MATYHIERAEIHPRKIKADIIIPEYPHNLSYVNGKIQDYAEAWRRDAVRIQHNPGQSIIYYPDYRVEFTRFSPAPEGY